MMEYFLSGRKARSGAMIRDDDPNKVQRKHIVYGKQNCTTNSAGHVPWGNKLPDRTVHRPE